LFVTLPQVNPGYISAQVGFDRLCADARDLKENH
jgi:hypothetical protein